MRGSAPESAASAALARARMRAELGLVAEQPAGGAGELRAERTTMARAVADQGAVGVGEVLPVRAGHHGRALAHGLDRVLPAAVDQRAADEGHGRELVEHAELADGVGDIGIAAAVGQGAQRAPRHAEAAGP